MAIPQPSQYQCDNMQLGDIIYVKHRNILYRWLRELHHNDKLKIKVRTSWDNDNLTEFYQEDCILLSVYDVKCVQTYAEEVPFKTTLSQNSAFGYTGVLKKLCVGINNIQIVFNNDVTITLPTNFVQQAINNNDLIVKNIDRDRLIKDKIKYCTHTGKDFKQIVIDRNITSFESSFCSICGKPNVFLFDKDSDIVVLKEMCECNELLQPVEISYEDLAGLYAILENKQERKKWNNFWFKDSV